MKVRDDLKDISNTVKHLMLLSKYFLKLNLDWGKWWHNHDISSNWEEGEIIQAALRLYSEGRDTAYSLGLILEQINSIETCPRLKDYINRIRDIQKDWITDGEVLLSQCEKLISKKNGKSDYSDLQLMMKWHRKTLNILKDLDNELEVIEKSERYKILKLTDFRPRGASPNGE